MVRGSNRMQGVFGWGVTLGLLVLVPACGPPQVAPEDRQLVLALATATSAREPQWLEACAAKLEERRRAGAFEETQLRSFSRILEDARAGRWEEARAATYALRDAQRPTSDSLAAVRRRSLPEPIRLEE